MKAIIKKITGGKHIHHSVFWPSAGIILLFVICTILNQQAFAEFFKHLQDLIVDNFGWFYILVVNIILIFCIYLAVSPFGKIRIGGPEARPEFSSRAWFAMLFSAGMGIGLLFWSVAEPVSHFTAKPLAAATQAQAAKDAMKLTFLHWGFHAWAIYALMGLALAYFTFNKKLPLTISSIFYPLLGDKIYGFWGSMIDTLAVLATMFGLATSLGLGAQQINSGLDFLYQTGSSDTIRILIIGVITLIATASVVLGLKKGVKRLSELNVILAVLFLLLVVVLGPTLFIADSFVENIGNYLQTLPRRAFWTEAYERSNWQNGWTVFYWGWWIAWSPFVGMFIARVSKGRTIREFIIGVLIIPTLITFVWLSVFGSSALLQELNHPHTISAAVERDYSTALFELLRGFPLSFVSGITGIVLIASFFVTSSDSGSLVIDSITSGGKLDAPVGQRIFWALSEGGVAIALLLGGGLVALQTASITTGLPFAIILLMICVSLYKSLKSNKIKI